MNKRNGFVNKRNGQGGVEERTGGKWTESLQTALYMKYRIELVDVTISGIRSWVRGRVAAPVPGASHVILFVLRYGIRIVKEVNYSF